jgi:PKD repeat protein
LGFLAFAETWHRPRLGLVKANITGDHIITTVAGNGTATFCGDGGAATSACLDLPDGVAIVHAATGNLAVGDLFIADQRNHRVRKLVAGTGTIPTVAGTGTPGFNGDNQPATSAHLNTPFGVAVDDSGNLFIADANNNRARKVTPGLTISTVAGNGTPGFSGDGGPATSAQLRDPLRAAFHAGNLFISDSNNHRIRKVAPAPTPVLTSLSPASTQAGGPAFTLTVNGRGFTPACVVRWNGADRSATFVSATQLTASIPATDIATPGTAQVTVFCPAPGGGLSNALSFQIDQLPSLRLSASASPTSGPAPLTVSFTASVSGGTPPYRFAWTFGDGGTSNLQNPSHTYTTAGSFTARVTVTDAAGRTASSLS